MYITLLGLIAGAFTTVSLVPQLVRILKTHHTKDLSLNTYLILTTGVLLWLMYGLIIKDTAVIAANGVTFLLACAIVYFKIKYG